ncbi:hypothetical protein ANSO36C_49660 [Nostoc cf. commune SO-36]|uniref:Uncharacterized protein n=1 Tax=Nostoc cf. commune SO-36 TaxID=449208 RepID=A0ABN6Q8M5_NOSCO|nr:hypothetical protein ANSO36C_49660 [Nostoc cf. commune SO-36]
MKKQGSMEQGVGEKTTHKGCSSQPSQNWSKGAFAHKGQGLYLFPCPLPLINFGFWIEKGAKDWVLRRFA